MRSVIGSAALALLGTGIVASSPTVYRSQEIDPRKKNKSRSKYMPHQGEREIARRLRQQENKSC